MSHIHTQIDCNKGCKNAPEGMAGCVYLGFGMLFQLFQYNGQQLEYRMLLQLTRVRIVAYMRR